MTTLTGSETGSGGLLTLKDSGWVLSLTIFDQPEVLEQPKGATVWWGYGLYPERNGDFVKKRMDQCTGAEILEEILRATAVRRQTDAIMASSICIPCNLPYVNNIWLPRSRGDKPPVVPEGATQPRTHRPVRRCSAGHRIYLRIFRSHRVGSRPSPAQARAAAAARLSGPVRSEGSARRPAGVCASMIGPRRG